MLTQIHNAIDNEQCLYLRHFCENQKWRWAAGMENNLEITDDVKILNKLPEIKLYLETIISNHVKQKCRSTQSWCTRMNSGQEGHLHLHKGFFLTSVLYLQDNNNLLVQLKNNLSLLTIPKNTLLILSASLKHKVPLYEGTSTRYSIVMNILSKEKSIK